MLPGPENIIECPHCKSLASIPTLASGNTFSAILWTDGKMVAPMLPEQTKITLCCNCSRFYWIKDAEIIGEHDWFNGKNDVPEAWRDAPSVRNLDIAGFAEALAGGAEKSRNQEKYLRVQLWWALNDLIRQGEQVDVFLQQKDLFYSNLAVLDELLQGSDDSVDQVMWAEIAREAGKFEECLVRLSSIPDEYNSIRDQLEELVQRKSQVVQELRAV